MKPESERPTLPDPDCPACGGEGVDTDPYGLFDFDCCGPCPDCWKGNTERLRELLDKATLGPWEADRAVVYVGRQGDLGVDGHPAWGGFDLRYVPRAEANAALIAELRNQAPALLDALTAAEAQVAELRAENARLVEAFIQERTENLWNAYSTGHERDGQWSHSFMSDGEWLIREVGLDPKDGWYDAEEVKRRMPEAAARAALEAKP
jgi:hypothetical protein